MYINEEPMYINFPFINDTIYFNLRNIFKSLNLNVRIVTKNDKTMNNYLKNDLLKPKPKCKKRNCSISNNKVCFRKNVVYEIKCMTCHEIYIGSTIQYLHERIEQHHTDTRSGIYQHKEKENHQTFEYKIIDQCQNEIKLRLSEGLNIYKMKPKLNKKHELLDALSYIKF